MIYPGAVNVFFSALLAYFGGLLVYDTLIKGQWHPGPIKSKRPPVKAAWYLRLFAAIVGLSLLTAALWIWFIPRR